MSALAVLLDIDVDRIFKGVDFANGLADKLIGLSIGIITFTITFMKDIARDNIHKFRRLISAAWILLFISIIAGIWCMSALSGSLINIKAVPKISHQMFLSAELPAAVQVLTFLVGVFLVVIYGVKALHASAEKKTILPGN